MDNGKMIKEMVMEYLIKILKKYMKETGKIINIMEKEKYFLILILKNG